MRPEGGDGEKATGERTLTLIWTIDKYIRLLDRYDANM